MADPLPTFKRGRTKDAVVDTVHRINAEEVPADERVAVFDNDGTL